MRLSITYDIIVIGGGHAGIEAALAAARTGCSTLLLTMNLDTIAFLSCNPAVGGLAKGQLVKEVDALGGQLGITTDRTAIQFRQLNASKGPAVRSSRVQVDCINYRNTMQNVVEHQDNLVIKQRLVDELIVDKNTVKGVRTSIGDTFNARAVIVTPGTFLNGIIHIGMTSFPAGRMGEHPSVHLSRNLRRLGLRTGRFKTGTCPRLDGRTIDFSSLSVQDGDTQPKPFSFTTGRIQTTQLPCYITYTNTRTHTIIRGSMKRSPLYTGIIKGTGVRYCPSIEDKIHRFPDRNRHQIFLEPEGRTTNEYYPNGLSTSLPIDVQLKLLRSIKGLKKVEITRPGYAIEHDFVDPTQLYLTLETKKIRNLYLAGQINGTTGYEEAAAQGLIAGINAGLRIRKKEPFILGRDEAYIGVLIDDLVTKGTNEPYRMFTSRAEYRLILREDNADIRLTEKGHAIGLISDLRAAALQTKRKHIETEIERLKKTRIRHSPKFSKTLKSLGTTPVKESTTLETLLKRPEVSYNDIITFSPPPLPLLQEAAEQVEILVKYQGYIAMQNNEVARFSKIEQISIPAMIDYGKISGLSNEIKEKLSRIRPSSLGQALRVSGVTPAAISILMIYLRKMEFNNAG